MLCTYHLHHQFFEKLHKAQKFEYNTNTIEHTLTCVVANEKLIDSLYLSPHDKPWWYIVPTLDSFHFYSVYIKKRRICYWNNGFYTKLHNTMYAT